MDACSPGAEKVEVSSFFADPAPPDPALPDHDGRLPRMLCFPSDEASMSETPGLVLAPPAACCCDAAVESVKLSW